MNDAKTTIADLQILAQSFREDRGWRNRFDLKDYPLGLVLEAAEVLELFQWMTGDEVEENSALHASIGEELSDVLYWVLSLADRLKLDLAATFEQKLMKQARKYPIEDFGKDVSEDQKKKAYYALKAKTRGGHPLAEIDRNTNQEE